MLGNCERTLLISSSTTNEWPQNHSDDQKGVMEKPITQDQTHQQQQQQQQLKCPRCDSSNTKFCYYNNYSLSQPRHFCKACKRYWTRGGTLRNVPVGGGCRKNKRLKRPPSATDSLPQPSSTSAPLTSSNPSLQVQTQMDMPMSSSSSNHVIDPLFYGLASNPSELTLPYPRYNSISRVSNVDTVSGFDLNPQLSGLGLGFSSSGLMMGSDVVSSSTSLLSGYSSASPTMASLLASTIHQQHNKFISSTGLKDIIRHPNSFQGLISYEDLQMPAGNHEEALKEVKMEQTQIQQISPSDPSVFWNSTSVGGAWLDPTNMGSSVPSLI
ncbi:hypothetical protein NMG60_11012743 [Bertholletia excelsa]